ncbi:glycosyltransferase family 9 protein [Candidatus Binatia bacterium]|nr:glycosyltransferase family 9 protein [Candidatus Binatia bacterium]
MTVAALRHVLLLRTDHLGDMLLTLPMVDVVKAAWPQCRVTVLASKANVEAARHHARVDRVEIDPHEAKGSRLRGLGPLVRQLRVLRCDAAVVVHPTPRLALAVWLAGIPVRVGTAFRAYSFLFNRRVREHRRRPPWKHESQYNVNLLAPLGIGPVKVRPFEWQVTAEDATAVEALLRETGLAGAAFAVLHPGSAGSNLNWSSTQYGELGRRLAADGWRLAVTGGASEKALTAAVAAAIGAAAVDLGGRLTVVQLAALLRRSRLYVGSSTGPTHLAAAVGTPTVALYSPLRSAAPVRWRPLGDRVEVLTPAVDLLCPKCLGAKCPYYHCMERHLDMERVVFAARRLGRL